MIVFRSRSGLYFIFDKTYKRVSFSYNSLQQLVLEKEQIKKDIIIEHKKDNSSLPMNITEETIIERKNEVIIEASYNDLTLELIYSNVPEKLL